MLTTINATAFLAPSLMTPSFIGGPVPFVAAPGRSVDPFGKAPAAKFQAVTASDPRGFQNPLWQAALRTTRPRGIIFYDLEAFVGVISAGLRADTDQAYRVGMDGREEEILAEGGIAGLYEELKTKKVRVLPLGVEEDIYQTDDGHRSIVEMVSNAIDAGDGDVEVQLKDGCYEVKDRGRGMNAHVILKKFLMPKLTSKMENAEGSRQIGRFGIGFYTVLRHLKTKGDCVEVETVQGQKGYRLVFIKERGRLRVGIEEFSAEGMTTGTTIRVRAKEIREAEMMKEMEKYLRYVNDGRAVNLNGKKFSRGEALREVAAMNRKGDYGKIYRADEEGSRITVKVGEIVVESYEVAGNGIRGDTVIAFPHKAGLTITRDAVVVDEAVYGYVKESIGRIKDVETLNTFVALVRELDKRHEFPPLMESLKARAKTVVESRHPHGLIYPDNKVRHFLDENGERIHVAPELFDASWWDRFERPRYRNAGYTTEGGWEIPIRLVLSPGLKDVVWMDAALGVLYVDEVLYKARPDMVWSALWMIPDSEFRVMSDDGVVQGAAKMVEPQPATLNPARVKGARVEEIWKFWLARGYSLDALGSLLPGGPYKAVRPLRAADRVWFAAKDAQGKYGLLDEDGVAKTPFKYDYILVSEAGGRVWFVAQEAPGKCGVLDETGAVKIPFKYNDVTVFDPDGRVRFEVRDAQWNSDVLLDETEAAKAPFKRNYKHGVVSKADGRGQFEVRNVQGKYGVLDKNGAVKIPFEYDGVKIFEAGGRVWAKVWAKIGNVVALVLIDADRPFSCRGYDDLVETSHGLALLCDDGFMVPLWLLEEIQEDPRAIGRLSAVDAARLNYEGLPYPLRHAGETVWIWCLKNPDLLPLIQTPDALALVSQNRTILPPKGLEMGLSLMRSMLGEFPPRIDLEKGLSLIRLMPRNHAVSQETYLGRIREVLGSGLDVWEIIDGKNPENAKAVQMYLSEASVAGIGRPRINRPRARAHRLADVITHLRLSDEEKGVDDVGRAKDYNNEEDRRQLEQAVMHLHGVHPHLYIRELMQNSLDVQRMQGRVAEGDHKIEMNSFLHEGKAVFRIRDYGGMTEEEFLGLLLPGEGGKQGEEGYRGRFGVGFKAALAGADWVRLKTAVKGAAHAIEAEFEVVRDPGGKIVDVNVRVEKKPNVEGHYGTMVESQRYDALAAFEAARIRTRAWDMGRYICEKEAVVEYAGEKINRKGSERLAALNDKKLGRVELYDGLANRLLLGGLPLADLPADLWEEIPEGIRDYYSRLGFYINLDHERNEPTKTRDRLRNHAEALTRLKEILPGLLIRGFLKRVMSARHPEDLSRLPQEYFDEAYNLAGRVSDEVISDGEKINAGRFDEVDMGWYSRGEQGRRELLKLLTAIRFVPVQEGRGKKMMSLREIWGVYQAALGGIKSAQDLLGKIRQAPLPPAIAARLTRADRSHELALDVAGQIHEEAAGLHEEATGQGHKLVDDFKPDRVYGSEKIKDEKAADYLRLLKRMTERVLTHFRPGWTVQAGIHTHTDDRASWYADHYDSFRERTYHLYRTYGPHFLMDVEQLAVIRAMTDRDQADRHYKAYLAELYEVITHELNHVLNRYPGCKDFTHDAKFRADQRRLMTAPELTEGEIAGWLAAE